MRILITGGTGFIGGELCRCLIDAGHDLILLTRNPTRAASELNLPVTWFQWSDFTKPPPQESLAGVHGIINLMGESVADGRWTAARKKSIYSSRITATQHLISAAKSHAANLIFFMSGSAIGFYGDQGEAVINESSPGGEDFLAGVCRDWEATLSRLPAHTRTVIFRIGLVLGKNGGALAKLLPLYQRRLGGPIGSGRHWQSWIHRSDLVAMIVASVSDEKFKGIYNAVSPHPMRQRDFAKTLGQVIGKPAIIPTPVFALRLAFGEMASIMTASQRVIPTRLIERGFPYAFANLSDALRECVLVS